MRSLFSHFQATRADQEIEDREAEYRAGRLERVIGRHRAKAGAETPSIPFRSSLPVLDLGDEVLEPLYGRDVYLAPLPDEGER